MSETPQVPQAAIESSPTIPHSSEPAAEHTSAVQPASSHKESALSGLLHRLGLRGRNEKAATPDFAKEQEARAAQMTRSNELNTDTTTIKTPSTEAPVGHPPSAEPSERPDDNKELKDLTDLLVREHAKLGAEKANDNGSTHTLPSVDAMLDTAKKAEQTSTTATPDDHGPSTAKKVGAIGLGLGLAASAGGMALGTTQAGATETHSPTPAAVSEYNKPITTLESPTTTTFAVSPRGDISIGKKDATQAEQTTNPTTPAPTETSSPTNTETAETTGTAVETSNTGAAFSSTNTDGEFKPQDKVEPPKAEGGGTSAAPEGETLKTAEADASPTDMRSLVENPDASPYTVHHADGTEEQWGKQVKGGDKTTSEITLNDAGKKVLEKFMSENGISDPVEALRQMGVTEVAYARPLPADGNFDNFDSSVKQSLLAQGTVTGYDSATGKITFATEFPKEVSEELAKKILGRDLTDDEKANGIVAACQDSERVWLGKGASVPDAIVGDTGILFREFKLSDGRVAQVRLTNTQTECSLGIAQAPPQQELPPPKPPEEEKPPLVELPPAEQPPTETTPPALAKTGFPIKEATETGLGLGVVGGGLLGASRKMRRHETENIKLYDKAGGDGNPPEPDHHEEPEEKPVGESIAEARKEARAEKDAAAENNEDQQLAELNKEINELADELNRLQDNIANAKGRIARMKAKLAMRMAQGKETSLQAKMNYRDSLVNTKDSGSEEELTPPIQLHPPVSDSDDSKMAA